MSSFPSDADVAWIDAIFGERAGALGIFLQQDMAVVMEVADDRNAYALLVELVDDRGDGGCGFFGVDRYPNQFRSGSRQRSDLLHGGRHIRGIGVGHRLHHYWCIRADADAANGAGYGLSTLQIGHVEF